MDVSSLLFGHSKALYSTWIYYKPDHLLIDCGEGVATTLGNGGYAIERVLLTHGHIDHISGLPSLLWSRAAGMGDTEKPLEIYYPRDDAFVADMQSYLARTSSRLPFSLRWIPLDAGDSFALPRTQQAEVASNNKKQSSKAHERRVITFATQHIRGRLTLGYKVVETRRRLKPEYATLSQDEIRARARAGGREEVGSLTEAYEATLVAFGGDGLPLNPSLVQGCELLVHEATILDPADRKHQLHATLGEAVEVAAKVQPKALVLYHISGRYHISDIASATCHSAAHDSISFPIWCLYRDRLTQLWKGQQEEQSRHDATLDEPQGNRSRLKEARRSDPKRNDFKRGEVKGVRQ